MAKDNLKALSYVAMFGAAVYDGFQWQAGNASYVSPFAYGIHLIRSLKNYDKATYVRDCNENTSRSSYLEDKVALEKRKYVDEALLSSLVVGSGLLLGSGAKYISDTL